MPASHSQMVSGIGMETRHTSKEARKDENDPQARSLSALYAGNAQDGNLGARVESQAKEDPDRIHFPRPIDGLKELAENCDHDA